ncbi:MAG: hypothetical protein UT30_C0012G0014 [Candidatus Uhrbacteria bacterium GW2011_GWF2_39_13]|uniref:Maf-like protein n=1 Tax=Candidatus Uhrbacteria bacterium GW2011_GWF2_39_13 TaxID=1618995 RepID=A0A0G0MLX2_9BACT|nr:MAG: hypothetical protein UT30_C0012G0014 [Candidatus Uhrbacteria bacterium GW2011_GWF2_39_13]HAU65993.1 hypothetical protein [Candidatus Uhrbacteria bacterium]
MKITLCGSIAFIDEMQMTKDKLKALGHEVKLPPSEILDEQGKTMPVKEYYALRKTTNETEGWIWDAKEQAMRNHFEKVLWADAILVLNHDKNGVANYIGANTLLEMGLAFHHRKKIFLLKPIPELSYKEEILGMHPIVLFGGLSSIV